ncbi:MAG TPA: LytTR family DNA-binding domain-containing protein [Puia sp.]|nr:LytTR family DNA-binding domain-containing protein [Puia sp.]
MSLRCIAVDDEPIALEIIRDYIGMVPGLELAGLCRNAMEALDILRQRPVDLVFLDIRMPGISGLQLIRSLPRLPAIVLTTAYPDYALEGFELDVVDYLLKPVAIDRFLRAVNKVESIFAAPSFIFVRSGGAMLRVELADILYIEGLENYVRIHFTGRSLIVLSTMKEMEESLPPALFLRIHRSTIVNLAKVEQVRNHLFRVGAQVLAVGKSYRKLVATRMGKG